MSTAAPTARGGAVATSHHAATAAGARALDLGGTAVDAAIAAAAALCVVYPNNVALGSDLVALVRDPSGRTRFVNATGRAARGETREGLRRQYGTEMPTRGIDTVTVPGALRGWSELADIGGSLSWEDLLAPARTLARAGHPLARSVARAIAGERDELDGFDAWAATFLPGGHALAEGDLLVQSRLADTLDLIAAGGPTVFYEGDLARRWISALQREGSKLGEDEVAAYQATVGEPLRRTVLSHDVLTGPPNTQGFALLRVLRDLELAAPVDPLGSDAGALAMLFRDANRVRAAYLADPDVGMDGEHLLTVETPDPMPIPPNPRGDTVGLVAVSDDGWAVSVIQSVYEPFGSGILDPGTGILFQDRGSAFSLEASHPAAFSGGRRPPHTLMPVLVERDGSLAYAAATMGGQAQPQIHTQLLLRLFGGASALEATSAPRWIVGRQEAEDTAESLILEADLSEAARRSLLATQLVPRTVTPHSESLGHSNVIHVRPDGYDAASDPRSDGSAQVVAESGPVR